MLTKALKELRRSKSSDGLEKATLGDGRLTQRAVLSAEAIARAPSASLPALAASDSELTALYRFFNNEEVTAAALLAPHFAATAERARLLPQVLAIHDTTDVGFAGERKGLGPLSNRAEQGFRAHVTLVASAGEEPLPLGAVALEQLVRGPEKKPKGRRTILDPENEFSRWDRGVVAARRLLEGQRVIHVKDREGDCYELFATMLDNDDRFVVRQAVNRRLAGPNDGAKVFDVLGDLPVIARRTVDINARLTEKRPPASRRKHPPREARSARLVISAGRVELKRPHGLKVAWPDSLALNVVHVYEPHPPDGLERVEWWLVTTEPIDSKAQVLQIVDWYRRRWLIEEFFKALKTGCAVEKRGFEEGHALRNFFALSMPIAWHMLMLRALARFDPKAQAQRLFSPMTLEVLYLGSRRLPPSQRPPRNPSVREALIAIAALGGHLKRNGDPGWLTLSRGYQSLLQLELGFSLAQPRSKRSRRDV
jgi:hypothetical protein